MHSVRAVERIMGVHGLGGEDAAGDGFGGGGGRCHLSNDTRRRNSHLASAARGDADFLEGLDDVVADAAGVGDGAILAHPKAFVDAASEMFGEVTVDIRVDDRDPVGGVNFDLTGLSAHFLSPNSSASH